MSFQRSVPMKLAYKILAVTFLLSAAIQVQASDPIPGVDVKLGRNPGGIVASATTDNAGRFVFDNSAAGRYVLSVSPQTKQLVNTTRSNIKHPSVMANGVQVVTASVSLGAGPASAEIEISAATGRIAGAVTRAAAPKEVGATSVRDTPKKAAKAAGAK